MVSRVVIVVPFTMLSRIVVRGDLPGLLSDQGDLDVVFVTRDPDDAERLAAVPRISWRQMFRPFRDLGPEHRSLGRLRRGVDSLVFLAGFAIHLMLVFRFNMLHGFHGFAMRQRQSWPYRRRALAEGHPASAVFGFPFPRSATLFALLQRVLFSSWQRLAYVERQLEDLKPDLLVLTHLQCQFVTPYVLAARARAVPVVGLVGSWDQPTTKGPLVPDLRLLVAQSRRVADELVQFHGCDRSSIRIAGWPQMDVYCGSAVLRGRSEILRGLGLDEDVRLILFGAYGTRLGIHEPDICRHLAAAAKEGRFGSRICLYIRCHPVDRDWRTSFAGLADPPQVVVEPPGQGGAGHLRDLLCAADVVVSTAGTIALDAIAVDTPAIGLAIEDPATEFPDQPARMFEMEHYRPLVGLGGLRLARSLSELDEVVARYVADPRCDQPGRKAVREECLSPLDGRASERVAEAIVESIRRFAGRPTSEVGN